MKKSISIIVLGVLNLIHFGSHFIQLIQSILLIKVSKNIENRSCNDQDNSIADMILHNPYFNIIWIIVAIYTIYAGIADFKYHKNHLKKNN